jgi:hypothetical protein
MAEHDIFERRLRAALVRHVDGGPTDFDALGFARAVAAKEPRRHGLDALRWASPARTLAWAALLALLLVALGASLLVIGALRPAPSPALHDVSLVPTGIDVLTPDSGAYGRTVVDGEGKIWAPEVGRLVQFDPASGSARTWTVADDAEFGMSAIAAPARAGGVWLIDGRMLRLFDGTMFRMVVEAPVDIAVATVAPDGSLWVATIDGRVVHWTGSSWTSLDPGRPNADAAISAIAVDAAGRPWIGWTQFPVPPGAGWVSRYDGSAWTTFDGQDASPLGSSVSEIVQFPDGTVWVASDGGVARFDGSSWTAVAATPGADASATSVAAGPDGAAWAGGGGALLAKRFDGQSWTSYWPPGGVSMYPYRSAWVMAVKEGLYLGTGAGILRLADDRWERAWPPTTPRDVSTLLAISRDELWAGRYIGSESGDSGLWHWQGGHWTNEPVDPAHPAATTAAMAIAPDGTVWAAGDAGVAYRGEGHWTIVDPTPASAIAFDDGGTTWVAAVGVASVSPDVWALRFDGTRWVRSAIDGCPLPQGTPSLAVDRSGSLWVGVVGWWDGGGLARFDGRSWEFPDAATVGATVLGNSRDGATWINASYPFVPSLANPAETGPDPIRPIRIDGEEQTVVEMPDGNRGMGVLLAPDGTLWAATDRGPARYDGQRWTFPYEGKVPAWMGVDHVATDGTLYGSIGPTIVRLPAPAQ